MTTYLTPEERLPAFLPYPQFLLETNLSHTARLLYSLLLDRSNLSKKNGWQDEQGRIYLIFPITNMAKAPGKSTTTVKEALRELAEAQLLERERGGFSVPSRLYLKVPSNSRKTGSLIVGRPATQEEMEAGNPAVPEPENQPYEGRKAAPVTAENPAFHGKETGPLKAGKPAVTEPGNQPYEGRKTAPATAENPAPNQTRKSHLMRNQTVGVKEDTHKAYGKYGNVFLTQKDYEELKEEFPRQLERFLEEMSQYLAANGKTYQNYAAALRLWASRDKKQEKQSLPAGWPVYTCKPGESL